MTESVSTKLKHFASVTEKYLDVYVASQKNIPEKLAESMLYSLRAGGKRLRPALLLGTYEIYAVSNTAEAAAYAASLEMIHTYSLIHDDLPAMDDDDLRRGKPSSHMVFGEAGAILAGDALLNCSMENLLDTMLENPSDRKIKASSVIMKAAGPSGMIGGQILDIDGTFNADSMSQMHYMKTGALFHAAVLAGGILGGCSLEDEKYLTQYARNLGCAFQIKDDILDVDSTSEALGKPVGSDSRNEKTTYVSVYGIKTAGEMLNSRIDDAVKALSVIEADTGFLKQLAILIRDRKD